jgi:hypothetical protein
MCVRARIYRCVSVCLCLCVCVRGCATLIRKDMFDFPTRPWPLFSLLSRIRPPPTSTQLSPQLFLFSNVYLVTPAIATLRSDPLLQKQCTRYVAEHLEAPDISVVFELYLSMHPGKGLRSVQTVIESNRARLAGISIE